MAPTVLLLGIPSTSPLVPEHVKASLQTMLDKMDADLESSPYEYESFYVDPKGDFNVVTKKLQEKKWDVVVVGKGLRTIDPLTHYFTDVVNAVHQELPSTKICFNASIESTLDDVKRMVG